jgi:hypothetical protein
MGLVSRTVKSYISSINHLVSKEMDGNVWRRGYRQIADVGLLEVCLMHTKFAVM